MSTLEKGYIWNPHVDVDINMKIDFVDQESITSRPSKPILHAMDHIYLHPVTAHKDTETVAPWWLRNTTYLENNLFADPKSRVSEIASTSVHENENVTSTSGKNDEDVSKSFELVDETITKLVSMKGDIKLISSFEIIPNESLMKEDHQISYLRFDEILIPNKRMKSSIVTNIRSLETAKLAKLSAFESSLVAPSDQYIESKDESEMIWIRDYILESQTNHKKDSYLLSLVPDDEDEVRGKVLYCPIQSRLEMKKMAVEDSKPVNILLTRKRQRQ